MHSKVIIAALLSTLTTACVYTTPPAQAVDENGRTWVKLSSDEPLVPDMNRRASQAGCMTSKLEHGAQASIHEVSLELVCRGEKLIVAQRVNWLGFQCSTLQGAACERMVLALTTDRRGGGMSAVGGPGWGI